MHKDNLNIQDDISNLAAFVARNNADTMYVYQYMKADDTKKIHKAIVKEVNKHI